MSRQRKLSIGLVVLAGWVGSARAQQAPAAPPAGQAPEPDLEVPVRPAPPAPATPPPAAPRVEALVERQAADERLVESLRGRVERLEAPAAAEPVAHVGKEETAEGDGSGLLPAPGFLISGYAQAQFQASQLSEDQLQQGSAPLNQDQFAIRRARVRFDRRWRWSALSLELDGNTVNGLSFGIRRAEASLVWDGPGPVPAAALTAGLFYTPFGYELPTSARTRLFAERSLASSALFPGQADLGVRLAGGWRFFRYALAVVNGEPLAESGGRLFRGDPNGSKDVTGRLGVDAAAGDRFRVGGGVSFLNGRGFHPGSDATKNGTVWRDINENDQIDPGEVTPLPATAATPSANFRRWAVGADLRFSLRTALGQTRLSGEAVIASNLDRGLFVADPVGGGIDVRELGFYGALVQDLTAWAFLGCRVDFYNPNADGLDSRAGKVLPLDQGITTVSPIAGARLGERTRLLVQFDHVIDKLARDGRGVPTDLKNDAVTARLQVDL